MEGDRAVDAVGKEMMSGRLQSVIATNVEQPYGTVALTSKHVSSA